jgi:hypothetical protein
MMDALWAPPVELGQVGYHLDSCLSLARDEGGDPS